MGEEPKNGNPVEESTGSGRSRHEILKIMRENKPVITGKKTRSAKPPQKSVKKIKFEKIADELNLIPGNNLYSLLKFFYEKKKATISDCKVMLKRANNFTDEQSSILKRLCKKPEFSKNNLLDITKLIRRFGINKILVLRSFVDLEDVNPSSLFQFFMAGLPRGNQKKMGKEAWEKELQDKMMTPDQINLFYNICNRIPEISAKLAIAILPRIRPIKQQHVIFLNQFLLEDSSFGEDPISSKNISALLNMWSFIPELKDKNRFKWLMKKLSRKLDKQQPDLKMLIQYLKQELEHEKNGTYENAMIRFRNLLKL